MDYKSSVKIEGLEPLAGTTRNMHSETYKIRMKGEGGIMWSLCGCSYEVEFIRNT